MGDDLEEFSVVYTNRSLNHMSNRFQNIMKEISQKLKRVYNADGCALIPGTNSDPICLEDYDEFQVVEHMRWKRLHVNMPQINYVL
jgi:hypothetical protein